MESIVVLVTCGSAKEAQRLGRAVVRKRLAACVNVVGSPVKSVYRWKGKVESTVEVLMLIKTTRGKFRDLEMEIRRLHSYETPEIIALPIAAGSIAYLKWLRNSVKA
ncbi:MAG: divalent-cation tolerance protein CutA [Candidatus Acidiferrales bacterium]